MAADVEHELRQSLWRIRENGGDVIHNEPVTAELAVKCHGADALRAGKYDGIRDDVAARELKGESPEYDVAIFGRYAGLQPLEFESALLASFDGTYVQIKVLLVEMLERNVA